MSKWAILFVILFAGCAGESVYEPDTPSASVVDDPADCEYGGAWRYSPANGWEFVCYAGWDKLPSDPDPYPEARPETVDELDGIGSLGGDDE